ncbi:hypothetical protein [Brevundimonas sp.]|uniref:hypothetical protein n=1 Tax=Brevundimonas sp. TaxID=1871086 RepID=UPI003D0F6176
MTPPALRTLAPLGWLALGVGVLAAVAIVLGGLGFRWDPFDVGRRRLERAERTADFAERQAAARTAEAEGEAGQVARLDAAAQSAVTLERVTARSIQTARTADDAASPLPADRVARLRDHDRKLCLAAPGLVGCSAAPDLAGDGEPAV